MEPNGGAGVQVQAVQPCHGGVGASFGVHTAPCCRSVLEAVDPSHAGVQMPASNPTRRYDPSGELLFCHGDVLSHPWRTIWHSTPLVLHDQNLLAAAQKLGSQSNYEEMDMTGVLSLILDKHPGPIKCFRVDSSILAGREVAVYRWLKLLSDKSPEQVVMVNTGASLLLEFPVEELDCHLQNLHLGFFSIPKLDNFHFHCKSLKTLQLIGCKFDSDDLYQLMQECLLLKDLELGLVTVNVKITSSSLQYLHIWKSCFKYLKIESSPSLPSLIIAARPKNKCLWLDVIIRGTPELKRMYLVLPHQKIEMEGLSLQNLKWLYVGIEMANHDQYEVLFKVMRYLDRLEILWIWRMDEITDHESTYLSNEPSYLPTTIQKFELHDFRGGNAELAFSREFLKCTPFLKSMTLHACAEVSKFAMKNCLKSIKDLDRASSSCAFHFKYSG